MPMGSAARPRRQGQNEERSNGSTEELRHVENSATPKQPELKPTYITVPSYWYTTKASRDHGAESNGTEMLEDARDKTFDNW